MATHSRGHGRGWRYAEFSFNGLEELKEQIKTLPMDLAEESVRLVNESAKDAHAELKSAYPVGPGRGPRSKKGVYKGGNLRKGLKYRSAKKRKGQVVATAWVRNDAPHAWLYDHGSGERNFQGAPRGSMPATHLFERVTIRYQLNLRSDLADLQKAHGLTVRAA